MTKTAIVAVGGNSLITDSARPDVPHQWDAVRETCVHLADMIEQGWRLVITHGNGPQVGYIMRRNELAAHEVHTTPLDLIVADTQGSIGYMLQQALRNELFSRGIDQPVVTIVTQVLVDKDDPAFAKPTKPVGAFLSEADARKFEQEGWSVVEDAGRGWRRVVASPRPIEVVEQASIRALVDAGVVVIAAGGGGIPVVHNTKGELRELQGVYAVIDKDWASGLLAEQLGADLFLISTGVPFCAINYRTTEQINLENVSAAEMDRYIAEGHFAPGSMLPKVQAAVRFVKNSGGSALITSPSEITESLAHRSGTWIVQ
ncbi:MAG: carbamate kinase [Caldilineales bacterium]|nr:carbamate kinase [Caldilineales bacterium]